MRHLRSISLFAALAAPCAAFASPITYMLTGTGTGTLGGTAFNNALITFMEIADTENIHYVSNGVLGNSGVLTVSIGGVGNTTLGSDFYFFDSPIDGPHGPYGFYGVVNPSFSAGAYIGSPYLRDWYFSTSLAPTGGDYVRSAGPLTGTGGDLEFSVFTDVLGSASLEPVAVTPEPSGLALIGTGLLGVFAVARRRLYRSRA